MPENDRLPIREPPVAIGFPGEYARRMVGPAADDSRVLPHREGNGAGADPQAAARWSQIAVAQATPGLSSIYVLTVDDERRVGVRSRHILNDRRAEPRDRQADFRPITPKHVV